MMSASSPHSRSSGMQSSKRSATLPSYTECQPNQMPAARPLSGSGNTWLRLPVGVLRIVLRTPVGGVSQAGHHAVQFLYLLIGLFEASSCNVIRPPESNDSVPGRWSDEIAP